MPLGIPDLPSDVPEEAFAALVETFADECRKIGLYVHGAAFQADEEGDEFGEKHHQLMMAFTIGDHAFSKAVQDPEARTTDLEIKKMESGVLDETIEDIRRRYQKPTDPAS